jgi:hypothetical protein
MPFPPLRPGAVGSVHPYVIPMTGGTRGGRGSCAVASRRRTRPAATASSPRWPDSAREVSDRELTTLLDGEWRSRLTAAWLIGLDRRKQLRGRIGDLLLASQDTDASQCPQAPTAEPGKSRAAHKATAAKVPAQAERDGVPVYGGSYGET